VVATFAAALSAWFAFPAAGTGTASVVLPTAHNKPAAGTKLSSRGMQMVPCATRWKFETDHWVCLRQTR
jgi:hypothetical protein